MPEFYHFLKISTISREEPSKYYQVKDGDLIKSIDELMNLTGKKPGEKTVKKTAKK
jgi:hypothetical protein